MEVVRESIESMTRMGLITGDSELLKLLEQKDPQLHRVVSDMSERLHERMAEDR